MLNSLTDSGIALILFLQSLGDWLIGPMRFFTFLGRENFFLFLLPVLYWSVDTALGVRFGIMLLFSHATAEILKLAIHSPRPYFYDPRVRALGTETSFGAPSTHALVAASIWGLLAAKVRRPWAWIVAIFLIFMVGLSRAYLGVHFPTDVVLGWAIGALLVWVFLRLEKPVEHLFARLSPWSQVGLVFGISLVAIFLTIAVRATLGAWTVPVDWLKNIAITAPNSQPFDPLAISWIMTVGGTLFGLACGLIWMKNRGGFDASGSMWNRIARFPIGLVGVLVLYQGLGAIFPRGEALLPYLLRYLRYTLVGFWVSGLAPWLFIQLKLATPQLLRPPIAGGKLEASQEPLGD